MRAIRGRPTGPIVALLAALILLAGQLVVPPAVVADPATVLDSTAALLYLALPFLSMVSAAVASWFEKPGVLHRLGPQSHGGLALRQILTLLLWLVLPPAISAIVAFTRAGDVGGDKVTLFVVIGVPALWLWVAALVGWVFAHAVHRWAAAVLAGLTTGIVVVAARPSLYPLGHSATMAGTTPTLASWAIPVLLTTSVVAGIATSHVLGVRRPRYSGVTAVGVGAVLLILMAGHVPAQTFERSESARRSCTSGPVVVCSDDAHARWREATAASAAEVRAAARRHKLTLPVGRIEILAGDTASSSPLPPGTVEVALDPRSAPDSMPAQQLAGLLVGSSCTVSDSGADELPRTLAATATWLAGVATGDSASLSQDWPEFAALTPRERSKVAQSALEEVRCGGRPG